MDTIFAPLIRDLSKLGVLSARRFSPEGDHKQGLGSYFSADNMLQLIDLARFVIDQTIPSNRKAR